MVVWKCGPAVVEACGGRYVSRAAATDIQVLQHYDYQHAQYQQLRVWQRLHTHEAAEPLSKQTGMCVWLPPTAAVLSSSWALHEGSEQTMLPLFVCSQGQI